MTHPISHPPAAFHRAPNARKIFCFLLLVIVALSSAATGSAQEIDKVWQKKMGFKGAPDPIAGDINADGILDIIQVDLNSEVVAQDPTDGRIIYRRKIQDEGANFRSPLVGNFFDDQKMNLVVPTTDGTLYILDGPKGEVLSTTYMGHDFVVPLATFPLMDGAEHSFREGLVIYDNNLRMIKLTTLRRDGGSDSQSTFKTQGSIDTPPVVGHTTLAGPDPHVAYITIDGRVTVFSSESYASTKLPNEQKSSTGVTLADLDGDGLHEIVVADGIGYLHAFRVEDRELVPFWPSGRQRIGTEPVTAPVAIDINNDGRDDIVTVHGADWRTVNVWNGENGVALYNSPYFHDRIITSPPALIRDDTNTAFMVFSDEKGVVLFRLRDAQVVDRIDAQNAKATPLIGALSQREGIEAFVRSQINAVGYLMDLGIKAGPRSSPWIGLRGGPMRTSRETVEYFDFWQRQNQQLGERIEALLGQAKQMASEKNWKEALRIVNSVRGVNPGYREAVELHRRYFLRVNIMWIVPTVIVSLLVVAFILFMIYRYGRAALEFSVVKRQIAGGKNQPAIGMLKRLCKSFPGRDQYHRMLSDLYITEKQFDEESAVIFERTRGFFPMEEQYLKALATAYSSTPRLDENAVMIYNEMTQLSKRPGPWHFLLGQTLMKIGQKNNALEAFRQTILNQHDDPKLPLLMTTLYIELKVFTPEIIPTMERVWDQRKDEIPYLNTLCLAYAHARQYDDKSQSVAEHLLSLDESAVPGHVILATRLLQSGRHSEAITHAEKILEHDPNDGAGLRLLGACYAAENRLDERAMDIFQRALQYNPDAPEILLAVSHGYVEQDRSDEAAMETYQKALIHNPQDEAILMQLARIAERTNDADMTIRAVEPLLEIGKRTRELVLQLAYAYCSQGNMDPKAEPIYKEALVHEPGHEAIQDNLAAIYMRQKKGSETTSLAGGQSTTSGLREMQKKGQQQNVEMTDEVTRLFEAVHKRHPERMDVGLYLMRSYIKNDLPEKALELGTHLQNLDPNNASLQKLMAFCSERADKLDRAISGYEQVMAGNPEDHEAICALSSLYSRKRLNDNKAIEIYNKAIRLQPNEPAHYIAAVNAYTERDSWDHAIQTIKSLLTHNPGQIEEAVKVMTQLVKLNPRQFRIRWYLVDTLIFQGRLGEARELLIEAVRIDQSQATTALTAYDKIIEKNPKDALAHLERGRILFALNREQESRLALEQAHRYHPDNNEILRALIGLYQKLLEKRDNAEMRFQLGRLSMRLEKYDLAISCFQATSKDYRWEGESIRNLAQCFKAKGMLDLALQELKRLPLEGDVKELMYDLGERYEAAGDPPGAREVYKLIYSKDINYKDVKGKLELLKDAELQTSAAKQERTAIINSLSEEAKQRYELIQELGRGAMGIVYKAKDTELDEYVALKILPDTLIRNQEAVRRFRQEARNARKLSHPNIVRIHDIGEEMGRKYISMEFVKGSDLKSKLRKCNRQLPFEDTLKYGRMMCEAMAYAHSIGIVHRDIKPANLMLTENDVIKVTDFGIAKMVEQTNSPDATQAGAIIGTPLYMSPEQVKGVAVDHRCDIYSMGIVLYEMASGRPPFTEGDLSYQHLFEQPKPMKNVPENFAAIVMKCLNKDREQRYQNADEVLADLNEVKPG